MDQREPTVKLSCPQCTANNLEAVVDGPNEQRCLICGAKLAVEAKSFVRWSDAIVDVSGVGRYTRLLPVEGADHLASADAALRPVEAASLAKALGVAAVRLIPQTLNWAGTFKDNEAVLLSAKCREWGLTDVCMHSSGNTARSYQYYMDRAGMTCTGFVPDASAYKCPQRVIGRSTIYSVKGNMLTAADAAVAYAERTGAVRLTPSEWKIEGKVPVGLAIAEHCPDTTMIAVTVASGYGPLGMQRGIERVQTVGLPALRDYRFRLFQAEDAGVLGAAIRSGAGEIDLTAMIGPERAFEPTLQSTNPNKTLGLVRALLAATGSRVDSVSVPDVEREARTLAAVCADAGIPLDYRTEKSAFICWAGLIEAARAGELSSSERIAIVVSGSGPLTPVDRESVRPY